MNNRDTFADRLENAAKARQALLERARAKDKSNDPEFVARQEARAAAARAREERETERRNAEIERRNAKRAEQEAARAKAAADREAEKAAQVVAEAQRAKRSLARADRAARRAEGDARCALRRAQGTQEVVPSPRPERSGVERPSLHTRPLLTTDQRLPPVSDARWLISM